MTPPPLLSFTRTRNSPPRPSPHTHPASYPRHTKHHTETMACMSMSMSLSAVANKRVAGRTTLRYVPFLPRPLRWKNQNNPRSSERATATASEVVPARGYAGLRHGAWCSGGGGHLPDAEMECVTSTRAGSDALVGRVGASHSDRMLTGCDVAGECFFTGEECADEREKPRPRWECAAVCADSPRLPDPSVLVRAVPP